MKNNVHYPNKKKNIKAKEKRIKSKERPCITKYRTIQRERLMLI
jgi:hypothetical protein